MSSSEPSSIGRAILDMIEKADRLVTLNQITRHLRQRGLGLSESTVEQCLRQDLQKHVKKVNGRWALLAEKTQPGPAETPASDEETAASGADLQPPQRPLARHVVRVLQNASGPLPTNIVATRLSEADTQATTPAVAAQLFDLKEAGHAERDGQGRWRAARAGKPETPGDSPEQPDTNAPEEMSSDSEEKAGSAQGREDSSEKDSKSGGAGEVEARTSSEEQVKREYVFRALAASPSALGSSALARRLAGDEETPEMESSAVIEHLERLRGEGRVLMDKHYKWHVAQDAWPARQPRGHEAAHRPAPKNASDKECVYRALAYASRPLDEQVLTRRLRNRGHDLESEAVIKHLCQLRDEERVLVDRRFGWQAVSSAREAPPQSEMSAGSGHSPLPDTFAPSGATERVTNDLERAGKLALVLALSPRPLSVDELAHLFGEMGATLTPEDARRLLSGPLHAYVHRDESGWRLLTAEERSGSVETSASPEALSAQTRADGMNYEFTSSDLDTRAFFEAVRDGASTMRICLNTEHPACEMLQAALSVGVTYSSDSLQQMQRALRLLLVGWARYEERLEGPLQQKAERARSDWGRSMRRMVQRHGQKRL